MRKIREWLVGICLNVEGICCGFKCCWRMDWSNFIKANGWGFVISPGVGFMLFNIFS